MQSNRKRSTARRANSPPTDVSANGQADEPRPLAEPTNPAPFEKKWVRDVFGADSGMLGYRTCQEAVADWKAARERYAAGQCELAEYVRVRPDDVDNIRQYERWLDALNDFMWDAERRLVALILMSVGIIGAPRDMKDLKPGFPACSVELDGPVYVVHWDEDSNRIGPHLVVAEDAFSQSWQYAR